MKKTCTFRVSGCERSVEAYVENGLYIAESKSGNGKTYLCKLLKEYAGCGEQVFGYSYNDYVAEFDVRIGLKKETQTHNDRQIRYVCKYNR